MTYHPGRSLTDVDTMKMLNGRRPRRPDDNFYRESRRSALSDRRDQRRMGFAAAFIVLALLFALVAWWMLRGSP